MSERNLPFPWESSMGDNWLKRIAFSPILAKICTGGADTDQVTSIQKDE